jgi:GLPGLI family protein
MMNRFLTPLLILSFGVTASAQNVHFPVNGVIEFEKSVNLHAGIKKMLKSDKSGVLGSIMDDYKQNQPQFKILKSTLTFSDNKTLFKPEEEKEQTMGFFGSPMAAQYNLTYTDLNTNTSTTQKTVYDDLFLVKDSTRKINWKITTETRTIAGYECRRANAIIMDSIYVVAFYTDKIPVSGGPESFTGLPGMILGVALPHENITWFAKTVTERSTTADELKIPSKGKVADNKGFRQMIDKALKQWGDYAGDAIKAYLL